MPGDFFRRRLFVWMPRRQWEFAFNCPHCPDNQSLTPKGLYQHLRQVVDFQEMFYLSSEHLECPRCKTSIIAWDETVLEQLPTKYREQVCVLLTKKYAIHKPVLRQLHARRKGNTPTALMEILNENHTAKWTDHCFAYLTACKRHAAKFITDMVYESPDPLSPLPEAAWLRSAYIKETSRRLEAMEDEMSSTFGSILKIDSTIKITRKLQGKDSGRGTHVTNITNDKGEILTAVLTKSESKEALKPMADGLVARYAASSIAPPAVLYTDRELCGPSGSMFSHPFSAWPDMKVLLEIWHFMCRLANALIKNGSDYYTFWSNLATCIYRTTRTI